MSTVHVAAVPALADWEVGHLLVELRTGRFTGRPWEVRTVSSDLEPVTTMGGVRWLPDTVVTDVDPADSDLLVLPGGTEWESASAELYVELARRFLAAGVPVAAICGATTALAAGGLLDDRDHTSAAPEAVAVPGYAGSAHYRDQRAVADRGLVTAGPQSPVHFAAATLRLLGLASDDTVEAYLGVFHHGDPSAYGPLMAAAA